MNPSIDPCDDFYGYICGNYPAHHPIKPKEDSTSPFSIRQKLVLEEVGEALRKTVNSTSKVLQFLTQMYSQCLHVETGDPRGVQPLIDLAQTVLGAWPMIRSKAKSVSPVPHWSVLFANVFSKLGFDYIFHIHSLFKKAVYIEGGPILLDPSQHKQPNIHISSQATVEQYRKFLYKIADILGSNQSKETVKQQIEALITFEQAIEKIYSETANRENDVRWTGSLADFQAVTGKTVDWVSLLNHLFDNFNYTNNYLHYTEMSKVNAINLKHLQLVGQLLNVTPIEVIQNFFGTALALKYGPVTSKTLREVVAAFDSDPLYHFPADCTRLPNSWPVALGRLYVETHFSPHEKADASRLVSEIKASFRMNLQTNSWLDETTKKAAIKKLDTMKETVAYSDWILDDAHLEEIYPELKDDLLLEGGFLEKLIKWKVKLARDGLKRTLLSIGNRTDSPSVDDSPIIVNAFYLPQKNSIG